MFKRVIHLQIDLVMHISPSPSCQKTRIPHKMAVIRISYMINGFGEEYTNRGNMKSKGMQHYCCHMLISKLSQRDTPLPQRRKVNDLYAVVCVNQILTMAHI